MAKCTTNKFSIILLYFTQINGNGFNEVITEGIPVNEEKLRKLSKKYHDLCYDGDVATPEAFWRPQLEFEQVPPKILQQIASIYNTWAREAEN